jgi:hypothetical protein
VKHALRNRLPFLSLKLGRGGLGPVLGATLRPAAKQEQLFNEDILVLLHFLVILKAEQKIITTRVCFWYKINLHDRMVIF